MNIVYCLFYLKDVVGFLALENSNHEILRIISCMVSVEDHYISIMHCLFGSVEALLLVKFFSRQIYH